MAISVEGATHSIKSGWLIAGRSEATITDALRKRRRLMVSPDAGLERSHSEGTSNLLPASSVSAYRHLSIRLMSFITKAVIPSTTPSRSSFAGDFEGPKSYHNLVR
jgi:hypothetical protein